MGHRVLCLPRYQGHKDLSGQAKRRSDAMATMRDHQDAAAGGRNIKTTIGLFGAIVLAIESVLFLLAKDATGGDKTILIVGMLLILVLVVVIAGWRYVKHGDRPTSDVQSLGAAADLPLGSGAVRNWCGTWNCRWTYQAGDGTMKPYVDDRVNIEELNARTGKLSGVGFSLYAPGETYRIRGQVSKRRMAQLSYGGTGPFDALSGFVLLSMSPTRQVQGWWLGIARNGVHTGGRVTWERSQEGDAFEPQAYRTEVDG